MIPASSTTQPLGGDYITDEDGVRYWLTTEQLDAYDDADSRIADDVEFNRWFREFRIKHAITSVKPAARSWRDFWRPAESKPKFLSEWSLAPVYRASFNDNKAVYLAEMLGGVQSIVRALEPPGVRYRVVLSSDNPSAPNSYTSYVEQLVSVSAQPLLDKSLDRGAAIDITAGEGLHEVSHVRDSEPVYDAIMHHSDGPPRPWSVGGMLLNLLEDIRIERNTAAEYPGFAAYFDVMNEYLWQFQVKSGGIPKSWGPQLHVKLNAVILSVKWPTQFGPIATSASPDLATEFAWWHDWGQRYLAGADARDLLIEGIKRLADSSADSKAEIDKLADGEANMESHGDTIAEAAKNMRDVLRRRAATGVAGGEPPLIDPCPTPGRADGWPGFTRDPAHAIDEATAAEAQRLLDESLMVDKPNIIPHGLGSGKLPDIIVLKPRRGYGSLPPLSRSLLNRMRDAFKFRRTDNDEVSRMLRSGRIDPTQLHRWKNNDWRIFDRRIIKSKPNTHVTLLIDQSGSMGDEKLRSAVAAAQLVHGTLRDMPGVSVRVRSHTADCRDSGNNNVVIYRIWETGEPMDQLTSVYELPHSNNADGFAIEWCARELISATRPNEQRLLIVFSDGQPAFSGYNHYSGTRHVADVVRWAQANGVIVVQIAIDSALSSTVQAQMFTNWLPYEGNDRLPTQVTNLLKRLV